MAKLIHGERIGRTAQLRPGAVGFVRDGQGRVLLTRRADNGRWCLPGGHIDPGESAAEACVREVFEETGLTVRVTRLIGVYSTPHIIAQYADGNRVQFISLCFAADIISSEPALSAEVTEIGFFTPAEIEQMDVMETHLPRISDGLAEREAAYVR
jgi:8-oxo-dGTP pyrophosphatase MutT (NUDIX family)